MKSAVETLNPTRVKLTVEVPFEELKPSLDAAYTAIGNQVQIPGFRKGKVPARIIEQRFGRGAVVSEAINEALPNFYAQAIEENDLQPLGQPEVDVTGAPTEGDDPLVFTAEVDVLPEFDLPDFSTIKVEVEPLKVTDEDVDAEVEALRERFGTLKTVERAATKGDFVTIDLKASIGDEEIDSVEGISYEVGAGNMLEGMDEALEGLKAGESKDFTAALAGGEHEGQDASCTVTLQAVKERELPELDDDFAQLASEHDTMDELREQLSQQAENSKRFQQGVQARDKVLEHLLENVEIALPQSIIDAEVNNHLEGEGRMDDDEHRAEVDESTRRALKSQILLDKIVAQDDVKVSQEELIEYLIMSAQQYGMDPNTFAQALDQQGQVPQVMSEVGRRKALASVLEKVEVVDTDGNTVDLNQEMEVEDDFDGELDGSDEDDIETETETADVSTEVEDEGTKDA